MSNVDKYFDDFCAYLGKVDPYIYDRICKNVHDETHQLCPRNILKSILTRYENFVEQKENEERIDYLCENPPI